MALWNALKAAVSAVITTNGNNDITGQVLRDVVNNNIIPQLGEGKFLGIATPATIPPVSPEKEYFYLASEAGIYANFAGVEISSHGLHSLSWDGASWALKRHFESADEIEPLRAAYVSAAGTPLAGGVAGAYESTTPYTDSPAAAANYVTYTYEAQDQNGYDTVYVRQAGAPNDAQDPARYRSVLVVNDAGEAVYLGRAVGDMVFHLRYGWTIQATVNTLLGGAVYATPTLGNTFDVLARKPIGKLTWVAEAATAIAAPDTFYKLAGTTALSNSYQTSMPADNELLWGGATVQNAHIHGSVSVESGNNNQVMLEMRLYDGVTLIEAISMPQFTTNGNGKAENEALNDILSEIQDGWHLELWGKNVASSSDITVLNHSKYFIYTG